jgi:hypothetical protein
LFTAELVLLSVATDRLTIPHKMFGWSNKRSEKNKDARK